MVYMGYNRNISNIHVRILQSIADVATEKTDGYDFSLFLKSKYELDKVVFAIYRLYFKLIALSENFYECSIRD